MNDNKRFYIAISAVTLVVLAAGFYIYKDITSLKKNTSDSPLENSDISSQGGTVKVQELPKEASLPDAPMPNLDRPIKFGNDMGADFEKIMTEKILSIQKSLKEDPTQFRLWMDLAANYRIIADFKGAEETWYYAHLMIPDNPVALGNLANLYAYDFQDLPKAEEYYKKAIDSAGSLTYNFFQASDFYLNLMKDRAKAIAVVELGLKKYPKDIDLKALLDSLKSQ